MEHLKVLIIDDEKSARTVLASLLLKSPTAVHIIGEAGNLPDAVTLINKEHPDLVFLDVEMPEYAGYEIVNFFDEINFKIIFTTAYDQYALKAFDISAVDYILKPINRNRLYKSITKVSLLKKQSNEVFKYKSLRENISGNSLSTIVISELGSKQVIKLADIIAIEAEGAYCVLHLTQDKQITASKNLKHFENILPNGNVFIRVHKSWIINKTHLLSYQKSKLQLKLENGIEARISKNKIDAFEASI